MPGQSNAWFAAVPPANVPTPNAGYYALFISDGSDGATLPGILHKKDSTGFITAAVVAPAYTDEQAQDAVAAALSNSATVTFAYNDAGNTITAVVPDASITAAKLAAGAVGAAQLGTDAVTQVKIADAAVGTAELVDASVTAAKLAAGAVGAAQLGTDAVTQVKIADAAVGTAELVDGNVSNAKLSTMAAATFKMRAAGAGTGAPIDGTPAQAKTALAIAAADVSGLGTAATMNATAFDTAGAAAAAQAASQPLDSDLTAIAALNTTSYGRALLSLADAAAETALLNTATSSLKGLLAAGDKVKLDNLAAGAGIYNVNLYGISTGNTGAVNLAAWNALMTVIPDNCTVLFPPSAAAYPFSATLVVPAGKHLRITGGGMQKSIIATTAATGDILQLGDWYQDIDNLKFTSTVTRTGGAAINSGNNVAVNVSDCQFSGMFDGIVYTGGVNAGNLAVVSNCQFTGTLNRGIVLDGANANTIIEKVVMDGTAGQQQVGLELLQCGSVLVANSDLIRSVNNLRFNPASPNGVFSAYFLNVFFDTATASSVLFTNTGNVQRVKFTNCWFSGSVIGCEFASTAASLPTAIDFINCDIFGNTGRGIYANGVQDFSVSSSRIAGNSTAGVEVVASPGAVTRFNLQNNAITATAGFGANGTGVLVNPGTYGGYVITGNDVRANTTATITDSGSVATTDLKVVGDNVGHLVVGSLGNLAGTVSALGTTSTALLSTRVPAKAVSAGQMFRFRVFGNMSIAGTVTFRVHVGAGGSTADAVAWVSVTSASLAVNNRAGFEGLLTVRAAGASGSVQCEALGFASSTALLPTTTAAPATVAVNTTNAWFITLGVVGSSGGGFVAQQAIVEAL